MTLAQWEARWDWGSRLSRALPDWDGAGEGGNRGAFLLHTVTWWNFCSQIWGIKPETTMPPENKSFQGLPLKTVYKAGETICMCSTSWSFTSKTLRIYSVRYFTNVSQSVVTRPIYLKHRCLRLVSDLGSSRVFFYKHHGVGTSALYP